MTKSITGVAVLSMILVGACGGPSRTISEQTVEFPKCDQARGSLRVEKIVCKEWYCRESTRRQMDYRERYSPSAYMARAAGAEEMSAMGLRDVNDKLTRMLVAALQETGCFVKVETDENAGEKLSDWRVSGVINQIKASVSGSKNKPLNDVTQTNQQTQKATVKVSMAVHNGDELAAVVRKEFTVSAKRVGNRKSNYETLSTMDWSRKRDTVGFGDTAMADVANEIMTEAAVFVTESTAGARISRRAKLPLSQESSAGKASNGPAPQGQGTNTPN